MNRAAALLTTVLVLAPLAAAADWKDWAEKLTPKSEKTAATSDSTESGLSNTDINAGLLEALNQAAEIAVSTLGRDGGFLDNPAVRIPMPDELEWAERSLRMLGQDGLADEFVATMNHAAEQAVPVALDQFQQAINSLTMDDVRKILGGPDDAATQFFRGSSETALREQFLPIVSEATGNTGVTSAYKSMVAKAGSLSPMLGAESLDLDQYVTDKALDGLFQVMAAEEARIRRDPVARTTDLLKTVFGGS